MYKEIVNHIKSLNWQNLSGSELQALMVLSAFAATEFASSLRISLRYYPESEAFLEMSKGELQTNNLKYGSYQKIGDHADFLWHFIEENKLIEKVPMETILFATKYFSQINGLSEHVRIMSIVSREDVLAGIFERVLEAEDWSLPGLPEFNHYLKMHIKLDKEEGGHSDLLKGFIVDDSVEEFYQKRLEMYKCIPSLF